MILPRCAPTQEMNKHQDIIAFLDMYCSSTYAISDRVADGSDPNSFFESFYSRRILWRANNNSTAQRRQVWYKQKGKIYPIYAIIRRVWNGSGIDFQWLMPDTHSDFFLKYFKIFSRVEIILVIVIWIDTYPILIEFIKIEYEFLFVEFDFVSFIWFGSYVRKI